MEKVNQESIRNGPGAVKGGREVLDRGTEGRRMDYGQLALRHVDKQASVHARMVMKMVLIEVKTAIGPSQGGRASTW